MLLTPALLFAALLSPAAAAPLAIAIPRRDVYAPPVLDPHAGAVWPVGSAQNVTWDTSSPPAQITNAHGMVLLTQAGRFVSGPGGLDAPLAANFSILQGRVEVQVPRVAPGVYQVVLFGDSGDDSANFTITN